MTAPFNPTQSTLNREISQGEFMVPSFKHYFSVYLEMVSKLMFTEVLDQKLSTDFYESLPRESNPTVLRISNDELTWEAKLKY